MIAFKLDNPQPSRSPLDYIRPPESSATRSSPVLFAVARTIRSLLGGIHEDDEHVDVEIGFIGESMGRSICVCQRCRYPEDDKEWSPLLFPLAS
ncbi:hypothetical protein V6N11_008539 [Hibiscus sabdariffa]|uniref:Uncharacterized protein n=1 Tax=Hibiscus sabdariffa TaxID=183260 RepID=A0ABR2PNK8_9ROSI